MFDTERIWATLWKPALATLGLPYMKGWTPPRVFCRRSMRAVLRRFTARSRHRCHHGCPARGRDGLSGTATQKAGPDELIALSQQHIPMVVASSRMASILRHLNNWHMTDRRHFVGEQFSASKPDPEIFLTAAKALGTTPAETLVLEDSYTACAPVRVGGFVTVMVPDLALADDEMRRLYTRRSAKDLCEVKKDAGGGKLSFRSL